MIDYISGLHPVFQALLAGTFTYFVTALGAATVFLTKKVGQKLLDTMLGFAAGVMISASFWSLLLPAIELSTGGRLPKWFPAMVGFLSGSIFLRLADKILPHLHLNFPESQVEGIKVNWRATTLMILAITLHNIPEGLAVGIAFGAVAAGYPAASIMVAVTLALGIGLQNFPEGIAVSMPLRRAGFSKFKSFFLGQLSGLVEPLAAMIGAATVMYMRKLLPYALAFAAGAMIFVVVEEAIPESQQGKNTDMATMGTILGFIVMMILDVAFS